MATYNKHNAAIRSKILQALADVQAIPKSARSYMVIEISNATTSNTLIRGNVIGTWTDNTNDPLATVTISQINAFASCGFFLELSHALPLSAIETKELHASGLTWFTKDANWMVLGFESANEALLFKLAAVHLKLVAAVPD